MQCTLGRLALKGISNMQVAMMWGSAYMCTGYQAQARLPQ